MNDQLLDMHPHINHLILLRQLHIDQYLLNYLMNAYKNYLLFE